MPIDHIGLGVPDVDAAREYYDELLPMLESKVADPPVGRVYPLDETGAALADLAARRTVGKSVVRF